jgi:hypothetical protein
MFPRYGGRPSDIATCTLVVGHMSKFRKRPVIVDAEQYDGLCPLTIQTLEGPIIASPGDWIITGIKGEKYPCKPEIFRASYEPVEPDAGSTKTRQSPS